MSARDLLFEIGTEEIPARFMPKALSDLKEYVLEELDSAHIQHSDITVNCTPRRLTVYVKDLSESQQDSVELSKGPLKAQAFDADGNATKAAEGFARSRGISVSELIIKKIGNAEYIFAEKREAGKDTASILPSILEKIIKRLSFPKSMYWLEKTVRFARPVRWIVALFGSDIVNVTFGSVTSGRTSRGHRFMGSDSITIASPLEYASLMEKNFVVVDPEVRSL